MTLRAMALVALVCASTAAIPRHIPTWAFDEYRGEGATASARFVRDTLNYAEGGRGNDKALSDCAGGACTAVFYFDPHLIYASDACPFPAYTAFLARAPEAWYVHEPGFDDAAHRVRGTYERGCRGSSVAARVYVADVANHDVADFFADDLAREARGWGAVELDDTKDTVIAQMYGPGGGFCRDALLSSLCPRTNEFSDDAALVRAQQRFARVLATPDGSPKAFFYNGLTFGTGSRDLPLLRGNAPFVGAICENCIVNDGRLRPDMYARVLEAMARVHAIPSAAFVELNTGRSPPGSDAQIVQRLVTTAVAWLGFEPGRTIVWPNLESDTRNLAVWPEDALYPTSPLESWPELEVAPGVWRREFARCYEAGIAIGPCAALLNANPRAVTVERGWLRERYAARVRLLGGDIGSGGTIVRAAFGASPWLVPPSGALLIAR
ncbi:MAG: hypothetical protein KGN02_09060 [bacterium]|nr:hypothetical protein [bacterium]